MLKFSLITKKIGSRDFSPNNCIQEDSGNCCYRQYQEPFPHINFSSMLNFRLATTDDLPTLNQISWQSKAFWGYPEEWMEQWRADLTITPKTLQTQSVLLLQEGSATIGFCVISEEATQYEVEHLWILPGHIGKGFGKQLLNQALAQFTTTQKPIQVVADPNAESFYRRQGFETFKQLESSPAGRFLPVMKKANTPS